MKNFVRPEKKEDWIYEIVYMVPDAGWYIFPGNPYMYKLSPGQSYTLVLSEKGYIEPSGYMEKKLRTDNETC